MSKMRKVRFCVLLLGFCLSAAPIGGGLAGGGYSAPSAIIDAPCIGLDNGSGTVTLPPGDCVYRSPNDYFTISDGLPPGTTIEIDGTLRDFVCTIPGLCEQPGGTMGGNRQDYDALLKMMMTGTGDLAGFTRNIVMQPGVGTHSAPRTPGDLIQTFATVMFQLQDSLLGDPDFDTLQITAGTGFGLPSPGETTLTQLGGGVFQVDSFFDITYLIDFVGAPGSILDGYSGSTTGTIRLYAYLNPDLFVHHIWLPLVSK